VPKSVPDTGKGSALSKELSIIALEALHAGAGINRSLANTRGLLDGLNGSGKTELTIEKKYKKLS